MSPIIGKRGRRKNKEGIIIWIGGNGRSYAPRVVLLFDDGTMSDHFVGDVIVVGDVAEDLTDD